MNVPKHWPRPAAGKLRARCERGWGGGHWFVYDETGRVLASGSVYELAAQRRIKTAAARGSGARRGG